MLLCTLHLICSVVCLYFKDVWREGEACGPDPRAAHHSRAAGGGTAAPGKREANDTVLTATAGLTNAPGLLAEMGRLIHSSVLSSTTTLSHLIFYVFYYPQHRRHPNSNKAFLALNAWGAKMALSLLWRLWGISETDWGTLTTAAMQAVLALFADRALIYIYRALNKLQSDDPQFSHISIHLTATMTWYHNMCLSLTSVRCFPECLLLLCHFPVPFLAWHPQAPPHT